MIFGNLGKAIEGEQTIYEAVNSNLSNTQQPQQSRFSRLLTALSHYGMNYNDKVIKNMYAIPADKQLQPKDELMITQNIYGSYWNNYKVGVEEEKPFAQKTIRDKREYLRRIAVNNELEDILDIMSNEAIVPDAEEAYICTPFLDKGLIQDLTTKSNNEIEKAMSAAFYKIYMLLNWKNLAWNEFKKWLIDGVLAYEIIYDDIENPKSIIGIVPLDPATLTKEVIDGTTVWTQFKGQRINEHKMLDTQIIYIKYEDEITNRQSYLERLIRPFNIYRIIEQAQIIWTVTQASFKTMFIIPVGAQNRARGAQTLNAAMNRYREDIKFNDDTGELKINNSVNQPFNKEYWMPENENGRPQIETIVDNGPSLNDSDQIRYFLDKLYKMSKIPSSRFDRDVQSTWFGSDPTQALRDELNFSRYVNKLRNTFGEILLKPMRIQVALSVPDLKNDKRILNSLSLHFNTYNPFEEMMSLELMQKRVEMIGSLRDSLSVTDSEGNETPYFAIKFLIEKYLKLPNSDILLNDKYKLEEILANKKASEQGASEDDEAKGDEDEEQEKHEEESGEENESGDLDKEMLGEVQPESPETTEP
jgi:hypothetical protein